MAIMYPYVVNCQCGETITATLADGVNVERTPAIRDEILAGRFHRITCPRCKQTFTAEKSFLYTDLKRGTFIQVKPRHDRHLWKTVSSGLTAAAASVPAEMLPAKGAKLRVAFGIAELREKLIAEDLKLDDRAVEMLKVFIINDHPFLLHRPRLRIMLNGASATELEFVACYDLDEQSFRVALPIDAARGLARDRAKLQRWTKNAGHRRSMFDGGEAEWVNMWRWSPQPDALDELRTYAQSLRQGQPIDIQAPAFRSMLERLPRGSHLPGWAKEDLQLLFDEAKRQGAEELKDKLFEVRFAKTLEDDWSTNAATDDIDTLWQLLRELPESDVAGNASIADINLDLDTGGGLYNPTTKDIYIGERELSDRENFEDVVRHEVGHGVHEKQPQLVNSWLAETFGWRMFPADRQGLDAWIQQMGGWNQFGVSAPQRAEVLAYLRQALGTASAWGPAASPNVPAGHPWWNAGFGPRLAYERTGSHWYQNYATWYRAGSRAFFINYWYKTLCVVNADTLDLVAGMPSAYAAMSTFEFFAELYALYHDLDDPLRASLPANVLAWFEQSGMPALRPSLPAAAAPEEFETISRP